MLRTNVYLTEEQVRELKTRAAVAKKPKAEILREVIDGGLRTIPIQKSASTQVFIIKAKKTTGKPVDELLSREERSSERQLHSFDVKRDEKIPRLQPWSFIELAKVAERFKDKGSAPGDLSQNLDKYTWDE